MLNLINVFIVLFWKHDCLFHGRFTTAYSEYLVDTGDLESYGVKTKKKFEIGYRITDITKVVYRCEE